jgi:hypothetical protein
MNMKKILLSAAILVSLIGAANASVTADLVQNGSFEANTINNGQWTFNPIADWTSSWSGNQVELRNNVSGQAYEGKNFVELDGYGNSSITQNISTVAGKTYTLSFAYNNRIDTNARTGGTSTGSAALASNGLQWNFGSFSGTVGGNLITDVGTWHTFSQNIVAGTTGLTALKFTSIGTDDTYGSSLDNVSVSVLPVPEAEEWAMMLVGLGLIGVVAGKQKEDSFKIK